MLGGFAVLAGVAVLVGGYVAYIRVKLSMTGRLRATGTVVDLQRINLGDMDGFKPIVEFVSQDGKTIRFTTSLGSMPSMYSKGEGVVVVYDPLDPGSAKIADPFSLWNWPWFMGVIGVSLICRGVIAILWSV